MSVYQSSSTYEITALPIEGNFLSMRYNETTDNVLISARPSKNFASPRHLVGQLSKQKSGGARNTFDVVNTFYGMYSSIVSMSRNYRGSEHNYCVDRSAMPASAQPLGNCTDAER